MTEVRERSWRAAGERARLAVVRSAAPGTQADEEQDVLALAHTIQSQIVTYARAIRLRQWGQELERVASEIEQEIACDSAPLHRLAAHCIEVSQRLADQRS